MTILSRLSTWIRSLQGAVLITALIAGVAKNYAHNSYLYDFSSEVRVGCLRTIAEKVGISLGQTPYGGPLLGFFFPRTGPGLSGLYLLPYLLASDPESLKWNVQNEI